MSDVGSFFDREAGSYFAGARSPPSSQEIARAIEARVRGKVLCVGGVWNAADRDVLAARDDLELTVVDVSEQMLERWRDVAERTLVADARDLPVVDGSIDSVVVPLVLHHITDGDARRARANVRRVVQEAARALRPGGTLMIVDFDLPDLLYAAERRLAGVTRRLLALRGIPLVIMHPLPFYETVVEDAGFEELEVVKPGGDDPWELMQPVIGMPLLKIPRGLYPLHRFLLTATKSVSG